MEPGPSAGLVADLQDRRDRHLIERAGGGSEDAFVELFRRYASAALGLAVRIVKDQALAEEATQDVFLSVWRNARRYDPSRGPVRGWILMQVHHRAVDVVRREHAERRRAPSILEPAGDERSVEDVIEEEWMTARRRQVRAALASLPADQHDVIRLAYFDGLTQTQIAARTGMPLGTVKSRTLAAMRRLHRTLGGGDER